jgi:hypothetical protein
VKGFDVNNTGDDGGWMVARSDAGADADAGSDPRPARANQGGFRGGTRRRRRASVERVRPRRDAREPPTTRRRRETDDRNRKKGL